MASLLPRFGPASRICRICRTGGSTPSLGSFLEPPSFLNRPSIALTFKRNASHKQQGSVNGPKQGPGKRLGAKKTGEQLVIPGNIIFRQRGTHWFPGTNVGMGRDHTIYAAETGYVKYYRDPARHPKRKYIGVAFERDDKLPYPTDAPRKRRLNMVAVPMPTVVASSAEDAGSDVLLPPAPPPKLHTNEQTVFRIKPRKEGQPEKVLTMRPGYSYREANWEIGRAAERAKVKVRTFQRGDRFLAWRKAVARKEKNVDRRAMLRKTAVKKRR